MAKKGKVKNGVNKAKHTKLLNQKKKRVQDAKFNNKKRLKDLIMKSKILDKDCPCGTSKTYQKCCHIAHSKIETVLSAEQLMRSRYTAFTMHNIEYLMKSHHSSTRPLDEKEEILQWSKSVVWDKLEVLNSSKDTVEFKAHFYENGKLQFLHENSKFIKEDGVWMYLDRK